MELTKQTQDVLARIFKVYKKRVKEGESVYESAEFSFDFQYNDKVLSKMNPDNVEHALQELQESGAIKRYVDGEFMLTDSAIRIMENKFKDNFKDFVDEVSKFIP